MCCDKRFELREENKTVFDHDTGLEWEAEVSGPMTWHEAMAYAEELGEGWRLPEAKELSGLVDLELWDPATEFPNMPPDQFWSSSSYACSASYAWIVSFFYGNVNINDKTNTNYGRCVRSVKES